MLDSLTERDTFSSRPFADGNWVVVDMLDGRACRLFLTAIADCEVIVGAKMTVGFALDLGLSVGSPLGSRK
jgi:hypothetical protein